MRSAGKSSIAEGYSAAYSPVSVALRASDDASLLNNTPRDRAAGKNGEILDSQSNCALRNAFGGGEVEHVDRGTGSASEKNSDAK